MVLAALAAAALCIAPADCLAQARPKPAVKKKAKPAATASDLPADLPAFEEVLHYTIKRTSDPRDSVDWHITLSPNGQWWALYRRQGLVQIRSLPGDELLGEVTVEGHGAIPCASADGKTLAVTTSGKAGEKLGDPHSDRTAIFTAEGWKQVCVIEHNGMLLGSPRTTALSPDGSLLAGASTPLVVQGRLRMWDVKTQAQIFDRENANRESSFARFSADGKRLLLVGAPPEVVDIASGKRREFEPPYRRIRDADFSPDGKTVAFGLDNGDIHFAPVATGKLLPPIKLSEREITTLRYAGNKHVLVSAPFPRTEMRLYDEKGQVVARQTYPEMTGPTELSITADGSLVAAKVYGIQQAVLMWKTPLHAE